MAGSHSHSWDPNVQNNSVTWNGPIVYGSNTSYPYYSSGSATTYTITYDGPPQTVTLSPHPTQHRYRTEIEQLLADVDAVCALGR